MSGRCEDGSTRGDAMSASDRHRDEARAFLAEYCTDERAGEHNVWDSECERLARVLAAAEQRGVAAGLRAAALHGHPCTRCAELERLRDERRAYDDASALVESWR
jgi:hypothetical protein